MSYFFHTDSRRQQREVYSRFLNAGARTRWLAEGGTTCSTSSHRREFGQLLLVRCFRDVVLEIDICLHKTYLAKSAVKIVSSKSTANARASNILGRFVVVGVPSSIGCFFVPIYTSCSSTSFCWTQSDDDDELGEM